MKHLEIITENRPWLSVTIDCQACQQGIWAIEVIGAFTEVPGPLVLEALTVGNGVTVTGVELEDEMDSQHGTAPQPPQTSTANQPFNKASTPQTNLPPIKNTPTSQTAKTTIYRSNSTA